MEIEIVARRSANRAEHVYTNVDGRTFDINVNYQEGGVSYFSGATTRRGYYISVCPVQVNLREDGTVECVAFALFGPGRKYLLQEAKRYHAGTFAKMVVEHLDDIHTSLIDGVAGTLLRHVLENIEAGVRY